MLQSQFKKKIRNVIFVGYGLRKNVMQRYFSQVIPFKLADIGEGIAEVEVMKWFIKEGDSVKAFDRICEVQSDKATVEITSRYEGTITRVYHEEGSVVKVGETLVDIQAAVNNSTLLTADDPPVASNIDKPVSNSTISNTSSLYTNIDQKVQTTPAVRKLAKENRIDLSTVIGTGPKNRISKEDILTIVRSPSIAKNTNLTKGNVIGKPSISSPITPPISTPTKPPSSTLTSQNGQQHVPIKGVQRAMVKSMTAARSVQHLTYGEEICFDQMKKLREEIKSSFNNKISYMPIILKLTSIALSQFPMLNATVNSEVTEMIYHQQHNIGVAMDTPRGLVVPVIHHVNQKNIFEIAEDLISLQESAMSGNLTEPQVSGGTFTISNIGSIGGTYTVPVVMVPQVAIGAFGRLQIVPRYITTDRKFSSNLEEIESGAAKIIPVTIMNVSWSADHRVIDGATIARFSNTWKKLIENPQLALLHMK